MTDKGVYQKVGRKDIKKRSVPRELLIIGIACVAVFAVSVHFKLTESLYTFILEHDRYHLDELLSILMLLTAAFAVFSYRRYTDLKNAAEEKSHLERDKDVYEKIVMAATDAMTFVDRDYRFQAVNDTMVRVWGRKSQVEFIGHHIKEFIGEDLFNSAVKAVYDTCFQGEQVVVQQWYEFEGFSRRFLYFIYNPYFEKDGTVSGAVVVATNLTELKETEEALGKSELKFRTLFDLGNIPAILIRCSDKTIVDVNDRYAREYGFIRNETIGRNYLEACRLGRPEELDAIIKEIVDQGSVSNREMTARLNDGTRKDVLLSASIIELDNEPYILASAQDITALKEVEKKLLNSLQEKDVLLKEVHHRVKNNMAVISSLLSLQARYIGDENSRVMFRESQERITSMALVHEQLYNTDDFSRVDASAYVKALVENIRDAHSHDRPVSIKTSVDEISLDIDNLVPLGLIMNEILTNSFRHAFSGTESPEISLTMKRTEPPDVVLTISDNGTGFPAGFDFAHPKSLGLQLITLLTEQVNGQIETLSGSGAAFRITFPEKLELARHLGNNG